MTRLPESAALLASSDRYAVQAFRVGEVAWGLQFHVEATAEMVGQWAAETGKPDSIAAGVAAARDRLDAVGEALANRFAAIVTG